MAKNNIVKRNASELGLSEMVKSFLTANANAKTYKDKATATGNEIKTAVDNLVTVGNSLTLTVEYADGTINGINISKTVKPSTKTVVKAGFESEYETLMARLAEITEHPMVEITTLRENRDYIK